MYEYRDIMAQLKYPGVSRCMSRIYAAVNMDDVRYSQEPRPLRHAAARQTAPTQDRTPDFHFPDR